MARVFVSFYFYTLSLLPKVLASQRLHVHSFPQDTSLLSDIRCRDLLTLVFSTGVEDVYCADAVACGSDADCPGGACWANSCCGGNICAPLSTVCTPLTKRSPRKDLTLSSGLEKMDRVCNSGALC
jgi:hypothetical protein